MGGRDSGGGNDDGLGETRSEVVREAQADTGEMKKLYDEAQALLIDRQETAAIALELFKKKEKAQDLAAAEAKNPKSHAARVTDLERSEREARIKAYTSGMTAEVAAKRLFEGQVRLAAFAT